MADISQVRKDLDSIKRKADGGGEYWMARDLMPTLGYETWRKFHGVIMKAQESCRVVGANPSDHFVGTGTVTGLGQGGEITISDYYLDRYACYLIAMNGDPSKQAIAVAQAYFAVQTRRQELLDSAFDAQTRIELRERVRGANKGLAGAAKTAGVQKFAIFQHYGYLGLYQMNLREIRRRKQLGAKEDLMDRAGEAELAANWFRATQATDKLEREGVRDESRAFQVHKEVGEEVRSAIKKLGGTMPEDLPAEPSIKKLTAAKKKAAKRLPKDSN